MVYSNTGKGRHATKRCQSGVDRYRPYAIMSETAIYFSDNNS